MKSKSANNSQEPLIAIAQLCVKGQLIGEEIKICREVKRGCSKEKQMGEKLLGRNNHAGGIEVNENSEDVGAQTVSHPVEIVCVGLEDASTSKKEMPEEVSSQRTLEMSLEDDYLQEDDPNERERKQVLQELEVVVLQKSSQQVIMEKIRVEIRELEVSVPPTSIHQSKIDHEAHFWFWVQYCMISKKLPYVHCPFRPE